MKSSDSHSIKCSIYIPGALRLAREDDHSTPGHFCIAHEIHYKELVIPTLRLATSSGTYAEASTVCWKIIMSPSPISASTKV